MPIPSRLAPLLAQFDFACERLARRVPGPDVDSGDGENVAVSVMSDEEYRWEPVAECWSIRRREAGPGVGATMLVGAGDWGRDTARPVHPWPPPVTTIAWRLEHPWPPPVTTIAWRLEHLSEMLSIRADHTGGSRAMTTDDYRFSGDVAGGIAAFAHAVGAWRSALVAVDDDAALDVVGRSTYPDGSDADDPFIETVWWVNQEVLHHGGEIGLLRDLYRARSQ